MGYIMVTFIPIAGWDSGWDFGVKAIGATFLKYNNFSYSKKI